MNKSDAIHIITKCAKVYHNELENRNLLFLFGKTTVPESFETIFTARNYLHLTGVATNIHSVDFYKKCLNGRIDSEDFAFASDGTTALKLQVLPQLMRVYQTAKMIGNYDLSRITLHTEKLAGNVSACMGFIRNPECSNYYIPNTALKEDIRNISIHPAMRVIAILRKMRKELTYSEFCYTAKGVEIQSLCQYTPIRQKLSYSLRKEEEHTPVNDYLMQLSHEKEQNRHQAKNNGCDFER